MVFEYLPELVLQGSFQAMRLPISASSLVSGRLKTLAYAHAKLWKPAQADTAAIASCLHADHQVIAKGSRPLQKQYSDVRKELGATVRFYINIRGILLLIVIKWARQLVRRERRRPTHITVSPVCNDRRRWSMCTGRCVLADCVATVVCDSVQALCSAVPSKLSRHDCS